jgi:hypothetical protein
MALYHTNLTRALLALKNIEPEVFRFVINELEAYSADINSALADAPRDQLENVQGRAQQAKEFIRLFRECHKYTERQ